MPYQLSTIIDEIIDLSKDPSLPRTRVAQYVQRTQDRVLGRHRYKFNEKQSISQLATGDVSHTPAAPYQSLLKVFFSHTDLGQPVAPEYLSPSEFFDTYPAPEAAPQGLPRFFTDYGGVLHFSCPLDRDYKLALIYQAAPKRLDDDLVVPDIPEEFSEILIKGGLAGIEQYRENFDIAALHERAIEDLTEDLLGRYGLRVIKPGKVRIRSRRG